MGCSPSKGNIPFPLAESPEVPNAVRADHSVDYRHLAEKMKCSNAKENEVLSSNEEDTARAVDMSQIPPAAATVLSREGRNEYEGSATPKEKDNPSEDIPTDKVKKIEKKRKAVGLEKRRRTNRPNKASTTHTKVDLLPHMARAHQAVYDYLIPNISKYESLLVLLNQAAQTHLSLQPMMTALLLRFEEINQALEEMAEEGELMLKEHWDYMSWPSAMTGLAVLPVAPSCDTTNHSNPPPDLSQQLLQHSTEQMKVVWGYFQGLGDLTLEEAVEYYASLSKLLSDRLHIKQVTEQRLAQVLARVEAAAAKKTSPEDSALHSEDSGIGGENESLPGIDAHRRHRGSAGSGSCGSGGCVRAAMDTPPLTAPSQAGLNGGQEEDDDDEEEDDEEEEEGDDDNEMLGRKRSNSSPPDVSQPRTNHQPVYQLPRRPVTACNSAKLSRSPLPGDVDVFLELQKTQKVLDRRIKNMSGVWGNRGLPGDYFTLYRACMRRQSSGMSSGFSRCAPEGPWKMNQVPCPLTPHPPGCSSVRRLINTFSQGVDGRPGQSLANIPPHIKRPRRSGTIVLPAIAYRDGGLVTNGNNNNNSWPDSRDDLDVESLPPPPPEVLMDYSFHSTEESPGCPVIKHRPGLSHPPRAPPQNIMVLPNRASVTHRLPNATQGREQERAAGRHTEAADADPETEKAADLYRQAQARKTIHLQNASESQVKAGQARGVSRGPCRGQGSTKADIQPSTLPVMAPPVSRVRLPPSCPSVHHRFPSPPSFGPQPTSGGSRPPSRAGSPRPWTRENSEEITPSMSFCNARSVFCQMEQQNGQTTSGSSVLPRPRGAAYRGRLPTRGTETLSRRTQSEQRACLPTDTKDPHGCRRASEADIISNAGRPGRLQMTEGSNC